MGEFFLRLMPKFTIDKTQLKERIMAVHCTDSIYIGLERKFVNFTSQKVLCIHDKCIRSIAGNSEYIGCCSYDGTATVFDKSENLREKIEGPETEIKGIAFYENFIAITTRGRTTWILEDFEISKILEDHTQDIKGCVFHKGRLYTWSYDNTIKVYDLFDIDHSWVLSQSIDLGDIVWSVVFFGDTLCAALHNGKIAVMKMEDEGVGSLWTIHSLINASATPIYTLTVVEVAAGVSYLAAVCNRNCILLLDEALNKVMEIPDLNGGCDVLSCSAGQGKMSNLIVCGSEDGTLAKIIIE